MSGPAQHDNVGPDSSARYNLLQIVRVRFRAFEEKFGRLPAPDEPLFFDETESHPVKASIAETRSQLAQAACEARVKLDPVLAFLGLAPNKPKSIPRPVHDRSARKGVRLQPLTSLSNHRDSGASAGWDRFLANQPLRRRHRITRKELQTIARVSFLGEARSEREYLLVLKIIRQRTEG